jgi:hypothetical protein
MFHVPTKNYHLGGVRTSTSFSDAISKKTTSSGFISLVSGYIKGFFCLSLGPEQQNHPTDEVSLLRMW